jgi:small nuclear ribonucleoprotein (snRNP)-like protein
VPTPVEPNTERTVVTQDGSTYHGEVVEFEAGSHILLKLVTGERRRIPWGEAKRISPPHTRGDNDPSASPERTVVMADGSTIRGELVEARLGESTTLKLASGQIRRIVWKDAKRILVPNPTGRPSTIPVTGELLVMLDNGKRIQGEYFEFVPDDHLVLRHVAGGFRIIPVGTIRKIVLLGEADK